MSSRGLCGAGVALSALARSWQTPQHKPVVPTVRPGADGAVAGPAPPCRRIWVESACRAASPTGSAFRRHRLQRPRGRPRECLLADLAPRPLRLPLTVPIPHLLLWFVPVPQLLPLKVPIPQHLRWRVPIPQFLPLKVPFPQNLLWTVLIPQNLLATILLSLRQLLTLPLGPSLGVSGSRRPECWWRVVSASLTQSLRAPCVTSPSATIWTRPDWRGELVSAGLRRG